MENGKTRLILYFKRNAVGEFIYECPLYTEAHDRYSNKTSYDVPVGPYAGSRIPYTALISSNDLTKKAFASKPTSISLKPVSEYFKHGSELFLPIPDDIELLVYRALKDELKREPSDAEIIRRLIVFSDRFGRNIDKIHQKASGYSLDTRGDIKDITPNNSIVSVVVAKPKPVQAQAEASAGKGTPTRIPPASEVQKSNNVVNSAKKSSSEVNSNNMSNVSSDTTSNSKSSFSKEDLVNIKADIRKKVIGQDRAIDDIVNNIFLNQKIVSSNNRDLLRSKANIILDGSTGTGKTFIIEEVASQLKLPIVVTSSTKYSAAGYKGDDITSILYKLLDKSDGDLDLAERGIVAFDEFDKLGSSSDNDISMRRAVQQELLTFISGAQFDVEYKGQTYNFDTSKLTFIGMGAFTNLRERKIKENEKKYKSSIGFSGISDNDIKRNYTITKEDYISEGLERELVGRFSCVTYTNDLTIKDMERILTESITSPLEALRILGRICDCDINISHEIISDIARRAYKTNTGARGLNEIVQSLKDVVSNDIICSNGNIDITQEHLDKTNSIHLRSYNAKEVD